MQEERSVAPGPMAHSNHGNGDNGNAGKGSVGGHTEGSPPIDGRLCVNDLAPFDPNLGNGDDGFEECEYFDTSTNPEIEIPGWAVNDATFTVSVCDGSTEGCEIGVCERTGEPCKELPVDGSGMALCQHPEHDETHRFNTYWNENSANGGGGRGEIVPGPEQPGR